jgi:hypothetical protein
MKEKKVYKIDARSRFMPAMPNGKPFVPSATTLSFRRGILGNT